MEYRENADIMYGIYDLNEFTYEQTINKHHYMMEAFPLPGKTFFSFTGKKSAHLSDSFLKASVFQKSTHSKLHFLLEKLTFNYLVSIETKVIEFIKMKYFNK